MHTLPLNLYCRFLAQLEFLNEIFRLWRDVFFNFIRMTRVCVIVLKWKIQKTDLLRYQILRKKIELRLRIRVP